MRRSRGMSHRSQLGAALFAALGFLAAAVAAAGGSSASVPPSALHACAVIAADAERLACYDQLSRRAASRPAAAAAAPSSAVPPTTATARAPAAATSAAATATAAARATTVESFGNYATEHPAAPPKASSLQARVVELGQSASGRMTVSLEGGAVWELDTADPLLAAGDLVDVRRAALGSFLMETPSKRTHRVRRLR
jgi:hypothetical protein